MNTSRHGHLDPLLTIHAVAREQRVSDDTIAELILTGQLQVIDGGEMARRRRFDVPVIRSSAYENLQRRFAETSRRDDGRATFPRPGDHPAHRLTWEFLDALQRDDLDVIAGLCTDESLRQAGSREALRDKWIESMGAENLGRLGIATGIYDLPFPDTIAIRVVTNPLPFSVKLERPTIVSAIPLALRREGTSWRFDRPLQDRVAEWREHAGAVLGA